MKKQLLMWFVGCFVATLSFAGPKTENISAYFADDKQIESLFENSTDISLMDVSAALNQTQGFDGTMSAQFANGDKNFTAAILLNFFLGGLGIHRLYLGTETMTWVGYILSCGGIFGVVPLIDFVVLIINNEDISPYVDNSKFFMWANN